VKAAGVIALVLLMEIAVTASAKPPEYFGSDLGFPFAEAVQVGDMLFLAGQIGNVPGSRTVVPGGIEAETKQTMDNIGAVLKRRGLGYDSLVKCTVMLADMKEWPAFNTIYATYFKPGRFPARSAFGANGLALGAKVELECWAHNPQK
jgi:2-iminobutanoate/2-iminopropanoate deaminase